MADETEAPRKKASRRWVLLLPSLIVLIGVVIVIVVVVRLSNAVSESRGTIAADQEAQLATALRLYRRDCDHYPTKEQGLDPLVRRPIDCPHWKPYLEQDSLPLDPWGNRFGYANLDGRVEIRSAGRDGLFITPDDIVKVF